MFSLAETVRIPGNKTPQLHQRTRHVRTPRSYKMYIHQEKTLLVQKNKQTRNFKYTKKKESVRTERRETPNANKETKQYVVTKETKYLSKQK